MATGAPKPQAPPTCDMCDDADAAWVIDREMTHGGGEVGPEYDAPVLRLACDGCKSKSSYMEPVPLTRKLLDTYLHHPWDLNL